MTRFLAAAAAAAVGAAACGAPAPRDIAWGQDECEHCHMTIADRRFAAEIVTRTGKAHVFDDLGCLARFLEDGGVAAADVHAVWVSDVAAPGALHELGAMRLLRTEALRTPMASGLVATRAAALDSVAGALPGTPVATAEVLPMLGSAR